jgi:hypothetical protein
VTHDCSHFRDGAPGELASAAGAPPSVAIAAALERVNPPLRARLLSRLVAAVGPLALAVVGGGAFAKHVRRASGGAAALSADDAAAATARQVRELVRYVQEANPMVIKQLMRDLTGECKCDCQ